MGIELKLKVYILYIYLLISLNKANNFLNRAYGVDAIRKKGNIEMPLCGEKYFIVVYPSFDSSLSVLPVSLIS